MFWAPTSTGPVNPQGYSQTTNIIQNNNVPVTSIDNPLPIDENTIFQYGSTHKTFTATAMRSRLPLWHSAISAYATPDGTAATRRPAAQPASRATAGIAATTRTQQQRANIGAPAYHEDTKATKHTKSL